MAIVFVNHCLQIANQLIDRGMQSSTKEMYRALQA
jgi:hypothetical protein